MGLRDFFRRRRERESPLQAASEIAAQGGSVSVGDPSSGGARVSRTEQSLDLRGAEGLRDDVIEALRRHGIDPESAGTVDASDVPGLQDAVTEALRAHGVDLTALAGMAGGTSIQDGASTAEGTDPLAARLEQLDRMRAEGALDEGEYEQRRRRLLDRL